MLTQHCATKHATKQARERRTRTGYTKLYVDPWCHPFSRSSSHGPLFIVVDFLSCRNVIALLQSTEGELAAREQEAVCTLIIEAHNYGFQDLTVRTIDITHWIILIMLFPYSTMSSFRRSCVMGGGLQSRTQSSRML